MKFTEIRNTVISRMTAQTIIDGKGDAANLLI